MSAVRQLTGVEPTTASAARAESVVKVYGSGATEVRALDGVSVGFPPGRFTAIMGPSGSGKSTLLHCLAGLDSVTSGKVYLGDREITACSEKERTLLRRDRMGFVFQFFNLLPTLTAGENITLPLALAGRKPDAAWLAELVRTVGLADRLHHLPSELSGGQQQRVAVARALVTRPAVVFADEPTGNLDSKRGADLLSFMRRAVDELGQTIVMVTHDPIAASHSDLVAFLEDGRVADALERPTVDEVLHRIKLLEG
jgi:putative ABC transport system ATP-binding protein